MKAKTKFLKMFHKLPSAARPKLVYGFTKNPMTLNIIAIEVRAGTKLGRDVLKDLGFEDDKKT